MLLGGAVPALLFGVAFGNLFLGLPFHFDELQRPVFTGGFFESDGNPKGGESSDWELLQGFTRELSEPFFGILPMNYRLRVRGVTAGTHTGTVTFTLVST